MPGLRSSENDVFDCLAFPEPIASLSRLASRVSRLASLAGEFVCAHGADSDSSGANIPFRFVPFIARLGDLLAGEAALVAADNLLSRWFESNSASFFGRRH